ncbi:MAG: Peptide chain release factor 1 [Parcubacteria group bacterium GW2011_GWA2_47_8]|nr:MAG: Peptide chain release factor 1 [Parcubacteria group bacterium GW2011_GWA2_47_8]
MTQPINSAHGPAHFELRKAELLKQLLDPTIGSNPSRLKQISQEFGQIEKELAALAHQDETATADASANRVILEIRAGTGGDEAALFGRNLASMYTRYAQSKGWTVSMVSESETDIGGLREGVLEIQGKNVFQSLQYESGTHRIQRIPVTEKSGRIHTSTATVAVLPLTIAIEQKIEISPTDLRVDTYRASGKGGQHVNKTESAVRLTHLPTGCVAACQDERSQHKNKEKAMRMLKARVYQMRQEAQTATTHEARRSQIGHAKRAEKIRTYNVPQNRVTDHRYNKTWKNLDQILDGSLDLIITYIIETEASLTNA